MLTAILIGAILVVLLVIIMFVSTMNNFRTLEVKIDESMSGVDIALTKRFDLLTKALETVKGYVKHETEILENIVNLRNPGNQASLIQKQDFNNKISDACTKINVLMENYPNLKADTQFTMLQQGIADAEEHLQAARRLYNSNVSRYNQAIIVFPKSIVAGMIGAHKKPFFQAEPQKLQDVNIKF